MLQDKLIKRRDETCERFEEQLKDLEKKYQAAKSNEGLQKIVEDTKVNDVDICLHLSPIMVKVQIFIGPI